MTVAGGALLIYVVVLWALSLPLRDASIADLGWGLGFVLVSWIALGLGEGQFGRRLLLAVLVSAWGLRLTGYLVARKLSDRSEDHRYAAVRERHPRGFPFRSLGVVFLLQGGLMWVVSLPVQAAAVQSDPFGVLDVFGALVWAVGMYFETVGDWQLRQFKADPANRGRVMDHSLWRLTRHPNYFGDFAVWWGVYLVALSTRAAWWTFVGPLLMSVALVRLTGKAMLERHMAGRPGYAEYVARTSGFLPLPPRR